MNFLPYRRIMLDKDLEEAKKYMKGLVLDLGGGRKRGNFKIYDNENVNLIVLDLKKYSNTTILGDAHHLPFKENVLNCIKCTELLEHVENPEDVIKEVKRTLKYNGTFILSTPFNFGIHADPYDFQRFTDYKLRKMIVDDFDIKIIKKQGFYFTVLGGMLKQVAINTNSKFRFIVYLISPLLDLMVKLDNFKFVKNSKYLGSFTTGFFIVATKK